MPYATVQHITDRYGEDALLMLADRDGDDSVDVNVVDQVLTDASAEIDVWLASRYSLPLTSTPSVLIRICVDIAVYRLSSDADVATEEKRQRFEDAISMLKNIANGKAKLSLPDSDIIEAPKTGSSGVYTMSRQRSFRRQR